MKSSLLQTLVGGLILLVGFGNGFLTVATRGFFDRGNPSIFRYVEFSAKKQTSDKDSWTVSGNWTYHNHHPKAVDKLLSEMEKSKGAIYRQSVLTKEELSIIQRDMAPVMSQLRSELSSIAQHRLGASLLPQTETVKIFQEGSICRLVRRMTGDDSMILSNDLPVQIRSYEKFGASMAWHEDDVLYDPPQIEVVFTLENTSDCVTMWKEGERLHSKETDPNSVLLLQAGGPPHCVTSLKQGRRVIIKCAYIASNAQFRKNQYKNQFQTMQKKATKSKNRK